MRGEESRFKLDLGVAKNFLRNRQSEPCLILLTRKGPVHCKHGASPVFELPDISYLFPCWLKCTPYKAYRR